MKNGDEILVLHPRDFTMGLNPDVKASFFFSLKFNSSFVMQQNKKKYLNGTAYVYLSI